MEPKNTTYDTIVCGAGAAGIMAALTLSRSGQSVLLLEKGGSLLVSGFARCGGPAACETALQKQEKALLTTKHWFDTLMSHAAHYPDNDVNAGALMGCLACTSRAIDYLLEAGIEMTLLPDTYQVGYRARHYITDNAAERIRKIEKLLLQAGVEIVYSSKITTIFSEKPLVLGHPAGIKGIGISTKTGTQYRVFCKNLLLCTGGFLGNPSMLKKYYGTSHIIPLGSILCTGDGIQLALDAGAAPGSSFALLGNEGGGTTSKMRAFPYTKEWALRNENLEFWIYGGLIVNPAGDRFINEELIAKSPLSIGGDALCRQKKCYCIMNQTFYDACHNPGIYQWLGSPGHWTAGQITEMRCHSASKQREDLALAVEQGWGACAQTLPELARHFHLPHLAQTVQRYNAFCLQQQDVDYHKSSSFLKPVQTPPFYAFEYEPASWGTQGGIRTNEFLCAVTSDNQPIPGLYIAGVDAGNLYANPYYPGEGCSVGIALGSGIYVADCILHNNLK